MQKKKKGKNKKEVSKYCYSDSLSLQRRRRFWVSLLPHRKNLFSFFKREKKGTKPTNNATECYTETGIFAFVPTLVLLNSLFFFLFHILYFYVYSFFIQFLIIYATLNYVMFSFQSLNFNAHLKKKMFNALVLFFWLLLFFKIWNLLGFIYLFIFCDFCCELLIGWSGFCSFDLFIY